MIIEILIGVYLVLFCLGFWTDLQLSIASDNKYYLFSIPLTAPIIGFKILANTLKRK